MKFRTVAVFFVLAATVAAAASLGRSRAMDVDNAFEGRPEIVAATFSSAWCAACQVLAPKLAKVIPAFRGAPVAFVELDFTFGDRPELAAKAARHGLSGVYQRNKGATGFTLLVDPSTGEIVDTLTMNFSKEAIAAAIARAVEFASSTDEIAGAVAAEKE